MKKVYWIIIIWLTVAATACVDKQKSLEQSIRNIEISDTATTESGIETLNKLYLEYALAFPEAAKSSEYLHRAALHAFLKKDFKQSRDLSLQYLERYSKGIEIAPTQLNLARIYLYGLEMPDSAIYYFQKSSQVRALTQTDIHELADAMEKSAAKLKSAAAADLYFEAANQFQKSGSPLRAIHCLNMGVKLAPEHPKAAGSLQTIAFIYENEIIQTDSALYYYQRLAREYPETEAATQANYLIKNNLVGKSAEEVLEFGLKNKGKTLLP